MFGTILRRLSRRLVHAVLRRRVLAVIPVLALLSIATLVVFQSISKNEAHDPIGQSAALASVQGQAPGATESFLRGNQRFDAELVWSSLSDQALTAFTGKGGSVEALHEQMAAAREQGARIEEITYIGGRQLDNSASMHFYLVRVASTQTRGQQEYVPYVFTLDASGKISKVQ